MSQGVKTSAASAVATVPDVNEAGRVLAQLNDWRAIVFVLVFIIVALLIDRWILQRDIRLERREQKDLAASFAISATKVADSLTALRLEITVLRATTARVESVVGTATPQGGSNDE